MADILPRFSTPRRRVCRSLNAGRGGLQSDCSSAPAAPAGSRGRGSHSEGRAAFFGVGRHDGRFRQRADPSEGVRLPPEAELQGRRQGQPGPVAVPDRRSRVQGGARPGVGEPRPGASGAETAQSGSRSLHHPLQGGGHLEAGIRYSNANHARVRCAGRGGAGGGRGGTAQYGVDASDFADRRYRGNREDAGRRPGRPHHAADDGLAARPNQGHLPDKRA